MCFGAEIFFAAVIAKSHSHGSRGGAGKVGRSVAEALRPKVRRFVSHPGNFPVLDQSLPGPSSVGAELDLVSGLRGRRVAGSDVGRRVDYAHRLAAWGR